MQLLRILGRWGPKYVIDEAVKYCCNSKEVCALVGLYRNNWIIMQRMGNVLFSLNMWVRCRSACKPRQRDLISVYEFSFPVSVVCRRIIWRSLLWLQLRLARLHLQNRTLLLLQTCAQTVYPQVVNVVSVHCAITKPSQQCHGIQKTYKSYGQFNYIFEVTRPTPPILCIILFNEFQSECDGIVCCSVTHRAVKIVVFCHC